MAAPDLLEGAKISTPHQSVEKHSVIVTGLIYDLYRNSLHGTNPHLRVNNNTYISMIFPEP